MALIGNAATDSRKQRADSRNSSLPWSQTFQLRKTPFQFSAFHVQLFKPPLHRPPDWAYSTSVPTAVCPSSNIVFTSWPSPQTMILGNRLNQGPIGTVGLVSSHFANA